MLLEVAYQTQKGWETVTYWDMVCFIWEICISDVTRCEKWSQIILFTFSFIKVFILKRSKYIHTYIDRVRLKHDLVENISSNNTLHIFTPFIYDTHINPDYCKNRAKFMWKTLLFDVSSITISYCRYIEINITEKPSLYTGLFFGKTGLSLIRPTGQELSIHTYIQLLDHANLACPISCQILKPC